MIYTFAEMTAVPDCQPTGAYQEFLAPDEQTAVQYALYSFWLADDQAMLGPTGRIVYPHGSFEDACVWVLLAANAQMRFYAERGLPLPLPNVYPGGGLKGTGKGSVRAARKVMEAIDTAFESLPDTGEDL